MTEKKEPRITYVTQRISSNEDFIDLECRFDDGQKRVAIMVDSEFPQLATLIVRIINTLATGKKQ